MPYARKRFYKRRNYKAKKKQLFKKPSKFYKTRVSKLRSRKIDTLVEKRMQAIARAEDVKNRVNLCLRQFIWSNGLLRTYNRMPQGLPVFYDGIIKEIFEVPKTDINQPLNEVPPVDPDVQEPANVAGSARGMLTSTIQGKRQTDLIKVTGMHLSMKVHSKAVQVLNQDHQQVGQMDVNERAPDQPPNVPRRLNTIIVRWAIVGILRAENILGDAAPIPDIKLCLPYHTWGYTPKLDIEERSDKQFIKRRTFIKGSCAFNLSTLKDQDKTINKFVRFSRPLKVRYTENDQNGYASTNWRFYLVCRSNVPHSDNTQLLEYDDYAPYVTSCVKLHYFE